MKKNKLKIITITLLVILLTMIAFIGVYAQVQNRMENKVKDYKLSMDLEGARIVTLTANKDTTETIKDSDGNVIESATDEEIAEKGYTKEEIPNNSEEELNIDNFNKSKKIIQDRLKKLNVENYVVRLNEKTGDIVIELPENTQTDEIVGNINTVGKLEIIDSETKEVLLNNDTIKASNALRSTSSTGTTVFLTIEFNSEGKKKLEEITKTYIPNPEESESQNDEQIQQKMKQLKKQTQLQKQQILKKRKIHKQLIQTLLQMKKHKKIQKKQLKAQKKRQKKKQLH